VKDVVTITFNHAVAYPDLRILEYSRLDPTAPFVVNSSYTVTVTLATSGAAKNTAANELIFRAGTTLVAFTGPGTGFTNCIITNPDADIAEDKTVTSMGFYAVPAPQSSTGGWVMQMAAFKVARQ
jgi:hypothetical protein